MVNNTNVLEIPLEPKNNLRAVIDCAGILKLRNADIELRTGETDIGRKNTCVRLVFRVHIPHPGGQYVSLQVASLPIECSQRLAHQLPTVESQDVDRCLVLGGQQMILTGQNFTSYSKVVFTKNTPVPAIKTEPIDDFQFGQLGCTVSKVLGVSPKSYHDTPSSHLTPNSHEAGLTTLAA
ncbi:nuclear factor of activated T-cells, cytoplasmic 2-like isoform X1 [Oncorhynchus kisutch]|uniref:nuclear factor of activated T-cells, cytoplasmic 2-like isoform X1 n=1 Tax=Oncorhynchus kisutch TaxID=8019 RepID=UPI0012DF5258|nr:nuclear factor of activated T-cells, cytoplasmic 2-like isoform X1 [Oncorhynchus kisutch]